MKEQTPPKYHPEYFRLLAWFLFSVVCSFSVQFWNTMLTCRAEPPDTDVEEQWPI
jgi:hypothetical protein